MDVIGRDSEPFDRAAADAPDLQRVQDRLRASLWSDVAEAGWPEGGYTVQVSLLPAPVHGPGWAVLRMEAVRRPDAETAAPEPSLPYEPPGLRDLIGQVTYKPGWSAYLGLFREDDDEAPRGWRLHIISDTEDSYEPSKRIRVNHAFPVPPASYNRDTWAAWLFDRFREVETHEAGEFFKIDGLREFAPHHGNGEDPYRVWHVGDHAATRKRAGED